MRRRTPWFQLARISLVLLILPSAALLSGCASTGGVGVPHGADDQLDFGVRMAQRGLWSEALFRFEKALELDPGNPKVLNNVAVALEAAGRYDEALEAYRKALEVSAGNRELQSNYARFLDFYESFRVVEEGEGEEGLEALQETEEDTEDTP